MGDNSGPGRKRCVGSSLVDLADVEGFDNPPIKNKVYGLEFANGIYRRHSIDGSSGGNNNLLDTSIGEEDKIYGFKFKDNSYTQEIIKPEKFEELENVNFENAQPNVMYQLVKNSIGEWFLMKHINWIIDVNVNPQNIFMGKQQKLKKIMNSGTALVSYVSNRKNGIFIHEQNNKYFLKRNNEVDAVTPVFLEMLNDFNESKFKLNDSSTIVIELFLLTEPSEFLTILQGLNIKWTSEDVNKSCFIYLRGKTENGATLPGVTFEKDETIKIDKIGTQNNFYFKRLLFINEKLPMEYLRTLFETTI